MSGRTGGQSGTFVRTTIAHTERSALAIGERAGTVTATGAPARATTAIPAWVGSVAADFIYIAATCAFAAV
jgi:hypothetical protein